MTEVELSRALLLTYAGVGAAFVVLGSLIVYTLLLGGLGHWRARRLAARQQPAPAEMAPPPSPPAAAAAAAANPPAAPPNPEPPLAAAIAAAVAMAQEIQRRERAESAADREPALPPPESAGWKEQGRIAAFDTRRLRDRER